jgi:hypothetical protein
MLCRPRFFDPSRFFFSRFVCSTFRLGELLHLALPFFVQPCRFFLSEAFRHPPLALHASFLLGRGGLSFALQRVGMVLSCYTHLDVRPTRVSILSKIQLSNTRRDALVAAYLVSEPLMRFQMPRTIMHEWC